MRHLRIKKLVILLTLTMVCASVHAQEQLPETVPVIERETYEKVIERLFPLDALDARENDFVLVLRYDPHFESNRQIVFAARDGKIFVTEYISDGNIWEKAEEVLRRTGREDVSEIAQNIKVKKREFNISAKLEESFRAKILQSVTAALVSEKTFKPVAVSPGVPQSASILLHGTTYKMWYVSKAGRLYFSEYGSKFDQPVSSSDSPFIRRMKSIYREIGKRK